MYNKLKTVAIIYICISSRTFLAITYVLFEQRYTFVLSCLLDIHMTFECPVTEHEHAHLVMMTRNMLKGPSTIDDVKLGNAFSSKEGPKTLRTLDVDQALACILKTLFSF